MRKLIAHRGWSGKAPENTMAAISLALQGESIDTIEMDVHLSKDGIPVVIHDFTLDRTTDGTGLVKAYTAKQLQQFDAGSWFDLKFVGERIPLLKEILQLTKGKKRLFIELKQKGNYYEGLEEEVVACIQQYEMQAQVVIISFDHMALCKVKALDPTLTIGLVYYGAPLLIEQQVQFAEASYVGVHYEFCTPQLVAAVAALDIELGVWTVDQKTDYNRLVRMTEKLSVTTNHPEQMA